MTAGLFNFHETGENYSILSPDAMAQCHTDT